MRGLDQLMELWSSDRLLLMSYQGCVRYLFFIVLIHVRIIVKLYHHVSIMSDPVPSVCYLLP